MATTTETTTKPAVALELTPPDPVPMVVPEKAAGLVAIDTEKKSALDEKVEGFVAELVALDAQSPEFGKKVDQITSMGRKEISTAAGMSNRFLDRPGAGDGPGVGRRQGPQRAAPHGRGPRSGPKGQAHPPQAVRDHPVRRLAQALLRQLHLAQGHIQAILARLASGKDELLMDNAAIDVERVKLWEAMGKLEQMVHIAKTLDDRLEEEAANLDSTDPAKAKAIRETALFYVRQRTQDLLTQMAVTCRATSRSTWSRRTTSSWSRASTAPAPPPSARCAPRSPWPRR
jgi:hypothetical protein